jgi:uncharacterized protein YegP (UPF0339 family)
MLAYAHFIRKQRSDGRWCFEIESVDHVRIAQSVNTYESEEDCDLAIEGIKQVERTKKSD